MIGKLKFFLLYTSFLTVIFTTFVVLGPHVTRVHVTLSTHETTSIVVIFFSSFVSLSTISAVLVFFHWLLGKINRGSFGGEKHLSALALLLTFTLFLLISTWVVDLFSYSSDFSDERLYMYTLFLSATASYLTIIVILPICVLLTLVVFALSRR